MRLGPIEPEEEVASDPYPDGAWDGLQSETSPKSSAEGWTEAGTDPSAQPSTENVQLQRKTTYDYGYTYGSGKPHAPSQIGPITQAYDANGNLIDAINTLPPAPGKRRQLVWDEENRLACNQDHSRNTTVAQDPSACGTPRQPATVRYVYDADGNRVIKQHGAVHIYPNRNYSERAGTGFKHVFIGETRIATKTVKPDSTYENHHFFFHADHLGSSSYVTDEHANLTEHLEYFAFGETWVNEHPAQPTPVPYQYGSKELDEETGFYYYGARYYNPRTNLWQSPDPALDEYLDDDASGSVFQPVNLASYTYTHNNPIKLIDPDGRTPKPAASQGNTSPSPRERATAIRLSPSVIKMIMDREGHTGEQGGVSEVYGFRQSMRNGFDQIMAARKQHGRGSAEELQVVSQLLEQGARDAGALNFTDPGIQAAIMSAAHMRGRSGAQVVLNFMVTGKIDRKSRLTADTVAAIQGMTPEDFHQSFRDARIAYDKATYGKTTTRQGGRKANWWDRYGKGLTLRYNSERDVFLSISRSAQGNQ